MTNGLLPWRLPHSDNIALYQNSATAIAIGTVVAVGIIWSAVAFIKKRSSPNTFRPVLNTQDRSMIDKFRLFSRLCETAYDKPYALIYREKHGPWYHIDIRAQGRIWLWKSEDESEKDTYCVVIRGTKSLQDLKDDFTLIRDSINPTRSSQWIECVNLLDNDVTSMLTANKVSEHAKLVFTGHSLGATFAECMVHLYRSRRSTAVTGITFDSPGQPSSYRRNVGMLGPIPRVVSLHAPANAINTLNISCAERLYCCGRGDDIDPGSLFVTARSIKLLAISLCRRNMRHQLACIRKYLGNTEFTSVTPDHWPTYSAWIVNTFFIRPERHFNLHIQAPPAIPQRARTAPPLDLVPESVERMELNTPYEAEDFIRFTSMLDRNCDKIIALAGPTSQGKTSVFLALIGPPGRYDRFQLVGAGANTNVNPIVSLYRQVDVTDAQGRRKRRRIFLVDLPGHGAEEQFGGNARFVRNSPIHLIQEIESYVGQVFYVLRNETFPDDSLTACKEVLQQAEMAGICVELLYNANHRRRDLQLNGRRILAYLFNRQEDDILCCVARSEIGDTDEDREAYGYSVKKLKEHLEELLTPEAQASDKGTLAQRERYAANQNLGSILEGTVYGLTSGSVTAAVTYWLGLPTWQGIRGVGWIVGMHVPTKAGAVALGPVEVTAGVAYTAFSYRSQIRSGISWGSSFFRNQNPQQ